MQANQQRIRFWAIIVILFVAGLAMAFWPRTVSVDLTTAQHTHLQVTVRDEGRTRVHDVYTLSAPIAGRLRRIELDVGDTVSAGESIVAHIEPGDAAFLDPRSEAQAKAELQAAESALSLASEEVKQAEAELEFADTEARRIRELRSQGTTSQRELDSAERNFKTARARLATAHAALQMRNFELQRIQALLIPPSQNRSQSGLCDCMTVIAPISGSVLKVLNKSEGIVAAGTPLLEIGEPRDLEIVVELLSTDAVKVEAGMPVIISNWGGDTPLKGQVTRVEPFGFTKYSALGIEEQRVNVLAKLINPYTDWQRLGHGYQVDADIVLWQQDDVLTVPITALFRQAENWQVYAVVDGRIEARVVEVGQKNTHRAQILGGLASGDPIVRYPNDTIAPGMQVEARNIP